ncbi:hypothetical protein [Pedobacter sp. Leaf216]|uniref:hypothetical protein n=1 Tax=Pedobacter sp. Leaf216 TaxID=1735684 RepID=UPI000AA2F293|nr:hypothetical protein [Pedobacter sp. Leaf216]
MITDYEKHLISLEGILQAIPLEGWTTLSPEQAEIYGTSVCDELPTWEGGEDG